MEEQEINKIRTQYQSGLWPQFIESIDINGLRAFHGETINFNFPVCAIVGENGSGKSTILKAIACAYNKEDKSRHFYPAKFFLDTHWDKIQNVTINYRIKRGNDVSSFRISKLTQRWNFPEKPVGRNVFLFDISRTLPLDATVGYAKIAKQAAGEVSSQSLTVEYLHWISFILGKDYSDARFVQPDINEDRQVGILKQSFGEVSQFHQGAGEDTTHDLFMVFQSIPEYSLLIIDEVEASLHPRAQRRLIRFLLWLSRHKRIQIIVSTHSPYIFDELPREARILLIPSNTGLNVVYGSSTEFAMSRIDDERVPSLHLFVEDYEAQSMLREIIYASEQADEIIPQIDINIVGPANVVSFLGDLSDKNKLPYKGLGVLDGDYPDSKGCIQLPGNEAPERIVFTQLKEGNWYALTERFGIGAGTLFTVLEDSMRDPDHHNWCVLIGNKLRLSNKRVWDIIVKEWVKMCLTNEYKKLIITKIIDNLN